MVDLNHIRRQIISKLRKLPASLTYHNLDHTLDVETQCMIMAKETGVTNEQTLLELRIAALYHDAGFLYVYEGHEEKSCELAKNELPGFEVTEKAIGNICEIILATKVPRRQKTFLSKLFVMPILGEIIILLLMKSFTKNPLNMK
jgi:uncharacterized protein